VLADGSQSPHAAGWMVDYLPSGEQVLFHDGLAQGGRTHLISVPAWKLSAAIAVNRGSFFSVRHGMDLLCRWRQAADCQYPLRQESEDAKIQLIVGKLQDRLNTLYTSFESGNSETVRDSVAVDFTSEAWADREAFLRHLTAEFEAGGLVLTPSSTHLQIGGIDAGAMARESHRFYDRVFTAEANLRFVYQFDGEEWWLVGVESAAD